MECPVCKKPMQRGFLVAGDLGVRFCSSVPRMRVACGDVIVGKNLGLSGISSRPGHMCASCKLIAYY